MSTKKQRRRQQKLRRHEYEEVWVDAEGNVVDADDDEEGGASTNGASRTKGAQTAKPSRAPRARSSRVVQPPSWGRVAKRGLFFAPLMFFLIAILPGGDRLGTTEKVFIALQYTLMLVLFMYLTERITYRLWRKRQGGVETQNR